MYRLSWYWHQNSLTLTLTLTLNLTLTLTLPLCNLLALAEERPHRERLTLTERA